MHLYLITIALLATLAAASFPYGFEFCKGVPSYVDISDISVSPIIAGEFIEVRLTGKLYQLAIDQG
jgi:hypothetical protein